MVGRTPIKNVFHHFPAGLPDGIFSNQKSQFGLILECLTMKDVGNFYGHSVYFTAISYILLPFSIFNGHFGISSHFGMLYQEKSGNPVFQ
jgi:hypothetical protein